MYETNKLLDLSASDKFRRREVDDRYVLNNSTGHKFESSGNRVKKASTVSSGRVVLFATVKVKTKPSGRSL